MSKDKKNDKKEPWNPLKKSYYNSDKVNNLSFGAEMLYVRLIAQSDDASNYEGDPFLLMSTLLAKRALKKQATIAKAKRWRDELVTQGLASLYKSGDYTYIHLIGCLKCLRNDVKVSIEYPDFTEPADNTTPPGHVTDTGRTRAGRGPDAGRTRAVRQYQDHTHKRTIPKGVEQEPSNGEELELKKEVQLKALKFTDELGQKFHSLSTDEATTFSRIAQYLSDLVRRSQVGMEIFDKALGWADEATSIGAQSPKAVFVAKVKQETGYTGRGMVLRKEG